MKWLEREKMGRKRLPNPISERVTVSISAKDKARVASVVVELIERGEKNYSSSVRRLLEVGLLHFETEFGLSELSQLDLFFAEDGSLKEGSNYEDPYKKMVQKKREEKEERYKEIMLRRKEEKAKEKHKLAMEKWRKSKPKT